MKIDYETKQILIIFIVFITLSLLSSCGEKSKKLTASNIQVSPAKAEDFSSDAYYKEYNTKTGKTIIISVTHPVGQSLSTIEISTKGFRHNY